MSLSAAVLAVSPIDAYRWTHHRVPVRPEVDPLDAGGEYGIRIHYVSCLPPPQTEKKGVILLIHGFPQTWYQFRHVITPLSNAGYHVIVPDYRGAGESTKTSQYEAVFTKDVMAADLHILLTEKMGITEKVHVVGHDIGGMIAHAYAVQFPEHTASVCWGECPLPGSKIYHERKATTQFWHFVFHSIPDLPEVLIAGKVREYQKHFFDRLCQNPAAFTPTDLDVYATAYSASGAMRCGLNVYRAFERDTLHNSQWVKDNGKSEVRCLALWGDASFAKKEDALAMCEEFYSNSDFADVTDCGHWIAEEQPGQFIDRVLKWVG
ncbi:hypothetical protein LTR37_011559 [Vermiconidia calcicola]|uniref:Uncharacterized protein n=1 Tax=Vermiconidia calcicola TaxID=1690605 RepID=A0ACC3N1N4_9PEZI|nr:hypothetical protein LTR37_011559 [Vermiconidia calcicola]